MRAQHHALAVLTLWYPRNKQINEPPDLSLEAQGVAVILFHNTSTLPLRMPAPAGTYRDSCRTQESDEKANLQQ